MRLSFFQRITRRQWGLLALAFAAIAGVTLLYRIIDVQALHDQAQRMNGPSVFAAMVVLPLLGFPTSVLHAVAGVRFGVGPGLALAVSSIVLQLLISFAVVKMAPSFFERWTAPLRKRLPKTTHTPLTQFVLLLPGTPYFMQLYVLPLCGVPFRTYILWSLPLHGMRSIIGVVFGHESADLTPPKIAGFVVYSIFIGLTCAWSFRRLQRRMKDQPAEEDGLKQSG
jgi:uncharacterized membrane protein YdjX (TVP38/TMEM64 family)